MAASSGLGTAAAGRLRRRRLSRLSRMTRLIKFDAPGLSARAGFAGARAADAGAGADLHAVITAAG